MSLHMNSLDNFLYICSLHMLDILLYNRFLEIIYLAFNISCHDGRFDIHQKTLHWQTPWGERHGICSAACHRNCLPDERSLQRRLATRRGRSEFYQHFIDKSMRLGGPRSPDLSSAAAAPHAPPGHGAQRQTGAASPARRNCARPGGSAPKTTPSAQAAL